MICYIFSNIDNMTEIDVSKDEIVVEPTDEHFVLQYQLWTQFMRDPEDIVSLYQSKQNLHYSNIIL